MSRRKDDVENSEVLGPFPSSMSDEALRLMKGHRGIYHVVEKKDCKLCRSFRRTILGGLSK